MEGFEQFVKARENEVNGVGRNVKKRCGERTLNINPVVLLVNVLSLCNFRLYISWITDADSDDVKGGEGGNETSFN